MGVPVLDSPRRYLYIVIIFVMKSIKNLPPRHNGELVNRKIFESRRGSKLLQMQANFQAKQLEEKEEKLINILEDKQKKNTENIKFCYETKNSYGFKNSTSLSNESFFENSFSNVRQSIFEKRKEASPIGWDKSYPLRPVEILPCNTRRGKSLERSQPKKGSDRKNSSLLMRTQSQTFVCSSSEDSYSSSRPQSGIDYNRDSNDSYVVYLSSDESPIYDSNSNSRDYSKPLPPSYRSRKNLYGQSTLCDSAYSSHSSDRTTVEKENKINSLTYKKQKSPARKSYRDENGTEFYDKESFDIQTRMKISERQREEEKRRMQVEMRKREQELLAKIKDQQRELEVIKAEKIEVEKALLGNKKRNTKNTFQKIKDNKKERMNLSRQESVDVAKVNSKKNNNPHDEFL